MVHPTQYTRHFEGGYTLGVFYISYSAVDDQQHK